MPITEEIRRSKFLWERTEYGACITGRVCENPMCRCMDRRGEELVAQRKSMASKAETSLTYQIQLERPPPNTLLVVFSPLNNLILIIKISDNRAV